MNLNPGESSLLVKRLEDKIATNSNTEVVICPPFIDLYPIARDLDRAKLKLGSQNIHYLDEGPFTGEISPAMLKGLAEYAIIGHSERRAMGEDDKLIAKKMADAIRNVITPILCVGETLDQRENGLAQKVVVDQLTADLAQLTATDVSKIVVAYEPVWAINHGDGKSVPAKPDDIKFAYQAIRTTLEELYGEQGVSGLRLLYGGSVQPDHCKAYLEMPYVDGLLVGGASLNYEDFAKIIKVSQGLK
jgi:triosephosphate isomerase